MELSWLLVFKIGVSLAGVLAGIGMFSELSWAVKLKLTATLLVGIILIGLAPLGTPVEPFGVTSAPAFGGAITLAGLAVLAGFIGYFLSWPNGREIGILAVPAGLAIVAAGFGGVLVGQKIIAKSEPRDGQRRQASCGEKSGSKANIYLNVIIAVVGSVFIAQFCIGIFAQDVRLPDHKLGSVVAQPSVGQIVFAVLVSFGIAAFLVKKFLNASYLWPIVASALVTGFAVVTYVRQDTLQYLIEHHPPIFFSSVVASILPVQMVSFGVLGSIAGYWLAVRYDYWRKHP
jgi:hypothetical protein